MAIILNIAIENEGHMKKQTYKNEPIEITETRESALIVTALGDIRPGTHASAEFFNKDLQEGSPARVSRQTVWNWANGSKCVSDARVRYWKLAFPETDIRHQLAVSIMSYRIVRSIALLHPA
jgi:hypothetical protein